jgi:hypothetical protein
MEILSYPLDEGIDIYLKCLKREREDRLYLLWVAYYTNPFASGERKTWEEFSGDAKTTSSTPKNVGKITGVDLVQRRRK